jgi:hypothetical protein
MAVEHAARQAQAPMEDEGAKGAATSPGSTAASEEPSTKPPPAPGEASPATGELPPPPPGPGAPRRPTRYGLAIEFEERPELTDLGRLVESTVLVNTAHAAYRRAVASRSEGYHAALTVGVALASVAVEPEGRQDFLSTFLQRWGEALGRDRRRRKSRPRTGRGS